MTLPINITILVEEFEKRKRRSPVLHAFLGFWIILMSTESSLWQAQEYPPLPLLSGAIGFLTLAYTFIPAKFIPNKPQIGIHIRLLQCAAMLMLSFGAMQSDHALRMVVLLVWAALCIFLWKIESEANANAQLIIDNQGVHYPGKSFLGLTVITWNRIEAVIIRNDFITIILSNKNYLQFQSLEEFSPAQLAAINQYCEKQLTEKNK